MVVKEREGGEGRAVAARSLTLSKPTPHVQPLATLEEIGSIDKWSRAVHADWEDVLGWAKEWSLGCVNPASRLLLTASSRNLPTTF